VLDAYEAERQPITMQVSNFAMDHAAKMIKARRAVPKDIEAQDAQGEQVRAEVGREAYELNVQQFCCAGLNFGYFYTGSPILAGDAEEETAPPYSMGDFTESTAPGCRAPHFWLADGRSLYDAFGPGYTLLRFDQDVDGAALVEAMRAQRVPLQVVDVAGQANVPATYRHKLVLCRTDQHVAWRGDSVPQDAAMLVERLRGAAPDVRRGRTGPGS
jgi:hypothetical protein